MANPRKMVEVSEVEVAVHWKEEELFYPPRDFIAQANMTDEKVYERFVCGVAPSESWGASEGVRV